MLVTSYFKESLLVREPLERTDEETDVKTKADQTSSWILTTTKHPDSDPDEGIEVYDDDDNEVPAGM